jgi:hypothetical protein
MNDKIKVLTVIFNKVTKIYPPGSISSEERIPVVIESTKTFSIFRKSFKNIKPSLKEFEPIRTDIYRFYYDSSYE